MSLRTPAEAGREPPSWEPRRSPAALEARFLTRAPGHSPADKTASRFTMSKSCYEDATRERALKSQTAKYVASRRPPQAFGRHNDREVAGKQHG